jgi:hypothetical protein
MTKRYAVEFSYAELRAVLAAMTFWEPGDGGERVDTHARATRRVGDAFRTTSEFRSRTGLAVHAAST